MLDVGCGDRAHWRADVLVPRFLGEDYAAQRNTGGEAAGIAPHFEADLEDLPIRDGPFGYVNCSHVLERVMNPEDAFREVTRVGKRGYTELPLVGIQK